MYQRKAARDAKSAVVTILLLKAYQNFTCAGCNACYMGEICTRVHEHLLSDNASHVCKHLQSSGTCRDSCSAESFTILDFAASNFQVKIKEALYIKWEILPLNRQLSDLDLSLSF